MSNLSDLLAREWEEVTVEATRQQLAYLEELKSERALLDAGV